MSELLDRIQREFRERLEASRAAVREHERLEAALHALSDAGARATRAARGSGRGTPAPQPSAAATPSRSRRQSPPAASGVAQRDAPAPAGTKQGQAARASASTSAPRKRAPRGANRAAVLGVIRERPGVTARELAAASGVTGGTLYSLLRTLTQQGALEKHELPGGQTGYAIAAADNAGAQTAAVPPSKTSQASADAERGPAASGQQHRADSTETDKAPSAHAEAHDSDEQPDADAPSPQDAEN